MKDLVGSKVEVLWHGADEAPIRLRLVDARFNAGLVRLVDEGPDAVFGAQGFWIETECIREIKECGDGAP